MPELPEVESVRLGLVKHALGQEIVSAQSFGQRVARRSERGVETLAGMTVHAVARRGKFLWFDVGEESTDRIALVAHLGMSGQFRVDSEGLAHVRARMTLGNGSRLDFVDQRTFGYLAPDAYEPTADCAPGGVGMERPEVPRLVAHIARDLLDPDLDRVALAVTMATKRTPIKKLLLDQTVVSGIGNIYADEALHEARIHPFRAASSLKGPEMSKLFAAATDVLERALAVGGTSFDQLYVNVNGESGYFERSLRAYGKAGTPCTRCGEILTKVMVAGRSSTYCPHCQQ